MVEVSSIPSHPAPGDEMARTIVPIRSFYDYQVRVTVVLRVKK